jgi:ATP-binding cassette, subfamily F, member 3
MILAQFDNVSFEFHDTPIVRNFTFQLKEKCRVGLIGANGSGKTTLFRILNGELTPDSGGIANAKDIRVGFLRQLPGLPENTTVKQVLYQPFQHLVSMERELERIHGEMGSDTPEDILNRFDRIQEEYERGGGYVFRAQIEKIMQGLGIEADDSLRPVQSFSGGEQARIMLARLLLEEPDLMLLDEPTNHLDIHAVEFLEQFLQNYSGGVMLVSHDRYFLDRTVTEIVELSRQHCEIFKGNYSSYKLEKKRRESIRRKHYTLQQQRINRLEEYIRRNMAAQKTKQAQSRLKELNRIERIEKVPGTDKQMALHFTVNRASGLVVFKTRNLSKGFDGTNLFGNINVQLLSGDRVGIIGPNGSGKSTLINLLSARMPPDSGTVEWGYHVSYAVYDQHLLGLNEASSVIDEVWKEKPAWTNEAVRNHLGRFLFSGDTVFKEIAGLSGGEKARVALAKLFLQDANLLFLDEPTNHLDVNARESIESALQEYPGSIVLVSHDRYLLDKSVNKIWVLDHQELREYLGNYSDYRSWQESEPASENAVDEQTRDENRHRKSKKEQRLERLKIRKKTGKSAAYYEKEIETLEAELQNIHSQLKNPDIAYDWTALDELTARERSVQEKIMKNMQLWEQAMEAESELE